MTEQLGQARHSPSYPEALSPRGVAAVRDVTTGVGSDPRRRRRRTGSRGELESLSEPDVLLHTEKGVETHSPR